MLSPDRENFQTEKKVVRTFHMGLDAADPAGAAEAISDFTTPDWRWHGMHPFNDRRGAEAVAEVFWTPLKQAISSVQRRPDIFIAGRNEMDNYEGVWVVEMGHLMGLFDQPWLGIRPTNRVVMLRYCEFNRVEKGRIVETAMFCDIPHLMMQAGQNPFPPQTGAMLVQPGPRTHTGLCYKKHDAERGKASLRAINEMLNDMAPEARSRSPNAGTHLARTWHDDMLWWGPGGIGATYTIERYLRQHSTPFGDALTKGYKFNGHVARLAESDFGGFFGWPNLTVANAGGFMGMPAGAQAADMRVVDMYRVEDGKLAENWIFIDMLHFLAMQGLDVLGRMEKLQAGDG
ncbi:MAG: ester cyclase [Parerythrobacter sp.]